MKTHSKYQALADAVLALHHSSRREAALTYRIACELAWITLRRHFNTGAKREINSVRVLFTQAQMSGLIASRERWMRYLEISARLSESTNSKTLALLFEHLPDFLADSLELLSHLEGHANEPSASANAINKAGDGL